MFCFLFFLLSLSYCSPNLKGVSPKDLAKYSGSTFKCDGGQKEIPLSSVNDDFCDCNDGSDEPGTSACSSALIQSKLFFCENRGYVPKRLFPSQVDDKICDCCDGSDEAPGVCRNTCEKFGEEVLGKLEKERNEIHKALGKKREYIKEASVALSKTRRELRLTRERKTEITPDFEKRKKEKESIEKLEELEREKIRKRKKKEWENRKRKEESPDSERNETDKDEWVDDEEVTGYKNEEAEKARDEFKPYDDEMTELEKKIENLEKVLGYNYGPKQIYFALRDKCFSKKDKKGSYEYELCFYGKASQKDANTRTTKLGEWKDFENDAYMTLTFENGQSCWKGPKRSLTVELKCGLTEVFTKVDEPSTCVYSGILESPLGCTENRLAEIGREIKKLKV